MSYFKNRKAWPYALYLPDHRAALTLKFLVFSQK